ncbi:ABC transporter substrate-binding protein [Salinithrix halophila]|uniref:ABC transporter substrate-binding protein n=1 Tax=Salinithrix halophila TaxID=1485204 RepID=A0ABV8JN51_9BACL
MRLVRIAFPLFLILFFTLIGCATDRSKGGLEKVQVVEVTHSLFYAPQYVAIKKGYFKEEGLDIQLTNGFGGDKTMAALLSGDADIVLVGAETGIYVTSRGAKDPVVAFAQLTQTDGTFLVSRKPAKDFEWKDLKGKTLLGQRKGGMPEMVSEHVQRKNGLKPHQDVNIIQNIDFKNLGSAFLSGTGDYAQLFEPLASKIEQEGKGTIVASFGKESGRLPYTVYLTREGYMKGHPQLIKGYIRALQKAQKWCESHKPEEIADTVQSFFPDTNRQIVVQVLERYQAQGSWATDPFIDKTEYGLLLDVMKEAGELPERVPYDQVIRMDLTNQVMKEPE